MTSDPACVFCQIVSGSIPSRPVYQDGELLVVPDIKPKAPVHLLIIPKSHDPTSIADLAETDLALVGRMVWRAKLIAAEQGIDADGYRLILNVRNHGGQEIGHLHLHLLGGRPLGPMI